MLELCRLSCGYGRHVVLEDVSLTLRAGELLCILGPNGVGKTTLFRTILGLLPAKSGEIRLGGERTARWPRRRLAKWMAYVPQAHSPPFAFKVREVVAMGRAAHLSVFASPRARDREIAEEALASMGIARLADASYTEISGGERQLVLIARALAQEARVLVMDEPTSNLDYGNQLKVLAHVRQIVADRDRSVILTTHQPEHALRYASRALVLDRERRCAIGAPAAVISEGFLRDTYGVEAEIHEVVQRNGRRTLMCVPAAPAEGCRPS